MRSAEKKLNKQQQAVVTHQSGPLLVVAGAGTGKTTTIIERIHHLISDGITTPKNIFAVTFTQKASDEMIQRLDVRMPLGYEEPWIGTFHALCDRILKAEGLEIGRSINYKIITPTDQWILLKKNIHSLGLKHYVPLGNPNSFIGSILKFFSRLQDEDITPEKFSTYASSLSKNATTPELEEEASKMTELSAALLAYEQIKADNALYDFGDLITKTLHLFRSRKSILSKYQELFTHVLVDEFQDTNHAQYELIKLLAPPEKNSNLMVVGDDDQSIYQFRGAAIDNILGFQDDYKSTKQIVLTQNYRSNKEILDSAYQLIQNNNPHRLEEKLGISKKLSTARTNSDNPPTIINMGTSLEEVAVVIEKIIELVSKHDYTYKDFAIMARANAHLEPFAQGLKRAGIPYQQIGNRGLFDQPEIRDMIHFLSLIKNPEDSPALFHMLHLQHFSLEPNQILTLLQVAKKHSKSLWQVIQEKSEDQKELKKPVSFIESFQKMSFHKPVTNLLHEFIITTNYIQELVSLDTPESHIQIKNINLFFDQIKHFESAHENSSVVDFVDMLDLWIEAGENPAQAVVEDIDTVNLLTIHASKGLEFPVVFISSLISGRFPSRSRKDAIPLPNDLVKEVSALQGDHIAEERRLMYVGMTRAKDYLFLTHATDYGGVRKRKPSGFAQESGLESIRIDPQPSFLSNALTTPPKATHIDAHKDIVINSLSYTQIDDFNGCPLKYKYRYILKVPTSPYQTLTFGRTIHETLHDFHRLAQQGRDLSQKEFIDLYKSHFDETGYDDEDHKETRFKKGLEDLKIYYKTHSGLFGKPLHLERSFKLKIDDVVINGKIDRIDETSTGFELIDYKTGKTKDQEKVDADNQLSLYALAANEVFNIKPEKMSLYFIESSTKVETTRTQEKLAKYKKKLIKSIQKIKSSDFKASPSKFKCEYCEYSRICPAVIK